MQSGAAYLVTQLCKMMFLATFFPASDVPSGQFDIIGVGSFIPHFKPFIGQFALTYVWRTARVYSPQIVAELTCIQIV